MPSTKLLKERIESIQDTMKITNAMYLISSSKLRKARQELTRHALPYFEARMREQHLACGSAPAGGARCSPLSSMSAMFLLPEARPMAACRDGR